MKDLKKKEKLKKTYTGIVISLKMQNTAIVKVGREIIHPLYRKILRRSKKYKVDTNSQELQVGDKVKIVETKPISKGKYFKVEGKEK